MCWDSELLRVQVVSARGALDELCIFGHDIGAVDWVVACARTDTHIMAEWPASSIGYPLPRMLTFAGTVQRTMGHTVLRLEGS